MKLGVHIASRSAPSVSLNSFLLSIIRLSHNIFGSSSRKYATKESFCSK
jgi:hypothetical protein